MASDKKPFDGLALGEEIVTVVKSYVDKRVSALEHRLKAVEPLLDALKQCAGDLQQERELWRKDLKSVSECALETQRERDRWRKHLDSGDFERRLAALEQTPSLKYLGVWNNEMPYVEQNAVTDRGSVWICLRSTRSRPGESNDWVLAVKRGQDGKDAR
jgi:hypothetical protein